jgi:hypothetical protein
MCHRLVFAYPSGSTGPQGSKDSLGFRRAAEHDHKWWLIPTYSIGAPRQIIATGQIRVEKHHVDALHCHNTTSPQHRLGHSRNDDIGFYLQPSCDCLGEGALLIYDKNIDLRHVIQPG